MKSIKILAIAGLLVWGLAACSTTSARHGTVYDGRAPKQYRHGNEVLVRFSDNVEADCAAAGLRVNSRLSTQECTIFQGSKRILVVPNPCRLAGSYAHSLCHGLSHVNGWPGNHPM